MKFKTFDWDGTPVEEGVLTSKVNVPTHGSITIIANDGETFSFVTSEWVVVAEGEKTHRQITGGEE